MKYLFDKAIWYIKQLLPLMYVTIYSVNPPTNDATPERRIVIWRMWFGRCFAIQDYALANE